MSDGPVSNNELADRRPAICESRAFFDWRPYAGTHAAAQNLRFMADAGGETSFCAYDFSDC